MSTEMMGRVKMRILMGTILVSLFLAFNGLKACDIGVTGWTYCTDTIRALIRDLEVNTVTIDLPWPQAEPTPDRFRFENFRRKLRRASGYNVIVVTGGVPRWLSSVPIKREEIDRDGKWGIWDSLSYSLIARFLKYRSWLPSDPARWRRFIERLAIELKKNHDPRRITINIWNEPDGTRINVVYSFYRMFVDTSEFLIGQLSTGDSTLYLRKLSDSCMEHPETVALVKRYYEFGGKLHDIDVCMLTVSNRLLTFVRDTLWTPEYYARMIYYPAYRAAKKVDKRIRVVPAAPMYATFVNFKDRLPPDRNWQDLHWDAGSIAQLVDWVRRFWNTEIDGKTVREFADGITHHFYVPNRGHLVSPEKILPAVLDSLMGVYGELGILGKKSFYVTEFGFATWPHRHPVADPVYDSQAVYYSDFLRIFYRYRDRLNIRLVQAYRWCDNPLVSPRGDYYGIIFLGDTLSYRYYMENPVPKPCYYVLREFSRVYSGKNYLVPDSTATSGSNGKKILEIGRKIVSVFPSDEGLICLLNGKTDTLRIEGERSFRYLAIASDSQENMYVAFCGDSGLYIGGQRADGRWEKPRLIFRSGSSDGRIYFPTVCIDEANDLHISFLVENAKASHEIVYGVISPAKGNFRILSDFERIASAGERSEPFLGIIGSFPVIVWKERDRALAYVKEKDRWTKLWEVPTGENIRGWSVYFEPMGRIHIAWSDHGGLYYRVYSLEGREFGGVEKIVSGDGITDLHLFECNGRPCVVCSRRERRSNPFLRYERNLYLAMRRAQGMQKWTFVKLKDGGLSSRYPQGVETGGWLHYLWTQVGYRFYGVRRDSVEIDVR